MTSDDKTWWEHKTTEARADAARGQVRALKTWHDRETRQYVDLVNLYERERWQGSWPTDVEGGDAAATQWALLASVVSHNILKPAVDSLTARLFSELPTCSVRLRGGTYDDRLKADRFQQVLNSVTHEESWQRGVMEWARDGLKTGVGLVRPMLSGQRPRLERISLQDVWWNPADAKHGEPRQLAYRQQISRSELADQLVDGEIGDDISKRRRKVLADQVRRIATRGADDGYRAARTYYESMIASASLYAATDMVEVWHHWRLPGDADSADGRYLIYVCGAEQDGAEPLVLWDGEWASPSYPLIWWSPYACHYGWVGEGIGHVLRPYQAQTDQAWARLQEAIDLFGKTTLAVDTSASEDLISAVVSPGINVVEVPDAARLPGGYQLIEHKARPSDLIAHLADVEARAMHAVGLNSGVMQGGSQLGANASGTALRVEDSRSDIRYADMLKRFDSALVQLAEQVLIQFDEAAAADGAWPVTWEDRWGDVHDTPWSQVRLEAGKYSIEITGAALRGKAQRVRMIEEWGQRGALAPELVMQLIAGTADDDVAQDHVRAAEDLVDWQLWHIATADEGDDLTPYYPDEFTDLTLASRRVRTEIQLAKRQRASDETIVRLIDYAAKVQEIQAAAQPPAPPPSAGGMPGMPMDPAMAMGGAPPMPMM